jgi:enoyl-[acyl-carrier-protein] reductase (NADH)
MALDHFTGGHFAVSRKNGDSFHALTTFSFKDVAKTFEEIMNARKNVAITFAREIAKEIGVAT